MNNPHSNVSDVPVSFQLDKYAACAHWGAVEWYQALARRYPVHLFSSLTTEEMLDDEDNPDLPASLEDHALAFLENPLPEAGEDLIAFKVRKAAIRDLNGADLYDGFFNLDHDGYEVASGLAKRACRRPGVMPLGSYEEGLDGLEAFVELERMPAWSIHRNANAHADRFGIEVDLGASDDSLVREFKAWLKRIRREAGVPQIPKRFTPDDFKDWHEKRLLPYLDLITWARAKGISLSLPVLGYALYPDEAERGRNVRDVEARIRRTIAPQALELMSWQLISTLRSQVDAIDKTRRA